MRKSNCQKKIAFLLKLLIIVIKIYPKTVKVRSKCKQSIRSAYSKKMTPSSNKSNSKITEIINLLYLFYFYPI